MNITDRARNMIINPSVGWNAIASEPADTNKIITGYVIPLAGLAALAAFIGYTFVGFNTLGTRFGGINWGIYEALIVFISAICSVYIMAIVVDMLAPSFGSEKNFGRSVQLVAYAFTPAWIGGLLSIFPPISLIGSLFGLYALYLMYIGLPKLKGTPADKQTGYFVVIIIATILVYIIIGWIMATIFMNIFGLSYGTRVIY